MKPASASSATTLRFSGELRAQSYAVQGAVFGPARAWEGGRKLLTFIQPHWVVGILVIAMLTVVFEFAHYGTETTT